MTTQPLPTNWPERVRQAAKRGHSDFGTVLNLLIKHDPDNLRAEGMDAPARRLAYARRLESLARAA